jgi:hypothetical protein
MLQPPGVNVTEATAHQYFGSASNEDAQAGGAAISRSSP